MKGASTGSTSVTGFCELGAYPVVPTLKQIRDFMVNHPDEVVILDHRRLRHSGRSRRNCSRTLD